MLPSLDYPYYELDIERGEICKPWLVKQETTIFINFVLTPLLKKKYIKKTIEIKLEYWLPGITVGLVAAPGSQLTSARNRNKFKN